MQLRRILKTSGAILLTIVVLLLISSAAFAQGSIYGTVSNADTSTPKSGMLSFFGFVGDTDDEIRIVTSDGAGYESGNWFDDFQNYLTTAPDIPYDYYFYNTSNGEGYHLAKAVPDNSFQQENVQLAAVVWPPAPTAVTASEQSPDEMLITWNGSPDCTYHIYRRHATSNGSLFRLDNPAGDLSDPGVSGESFVDTTVDGVSEYDYLVIAEDASGNYSPVFSSIVCGDANSSGDLDIDDIIFVIDYMFAGGPPPDPYSAADPNCSGDIDMDDVVYLIDYMFFAGRTPCDPDGDGVPDC
jgi:hypothetical protein